MVADRRYRVQFCREIALGTLKIWGIASVFIGKVHSVPPKIVAKKKPGGKPGEFFACYKRNKFIC